MTTSARQYLLRGTLAWLPLPVLAVANAALRELALLPLLGAKLAQPLSGLTLIALIGLYSFVIFRKVIAGAGPGVAWLLGLIWAGLTLAFEYALMAAAHELPLARLADTLSPSAVSEGNLFVLAVIFLALSPRLFNRDAPQG
jgi:hypothetical protein